jgi:hypothetical protein
MCSVEETVGSSDSKPPLPESRFLVVFETLLTVSLVGHALIALANGASYSTWSRPARRTLKSLVFGTMKWG